MTTIVFSHPWEGSFNRAILDGVDKKLREEKRPYQVINLIADGFNPTMTVNDLALYNRGETADPLVVKYGEILQNTDELIIIFPIWWGMMPAIFKGFLDKVLLKGVAYNYSEEGAMLPAFDIRRTVLITTSQGPTALYRHFIEDNLIDFVLNSVGINNVKWYNCDRTAHGPRENREEFLKRVISKV
ncbi:MAG: NAD(P)H-dependent oxidoreductase [Muribaculaceae bacterium]|nr:NAD(P)H-dependent oxidoreductase [Muribaculaceae bacterium]